MTYNPQKLFPELLFEPLQDWSLDIAIKHDFIKRIILFRAPVGFCKVEIRYLLCFEFENPQTNDPKQKAVIDLIKYSSGDHPFKIGLFYEKEIFYKDMAAPPNFINQWQLLAEIPPEIIKKPKWILFQKEGFKSQTKLSKKDLDINVVREAKRCYDVHKELRKEEEKKDSSLTKENWRKGIERLEPEKKYTVVDIQALLNLIANKS